MNLEYRTSRLSVFEIFRDLTHPELSELLARVIELLTPSVVENLPPYFQGIESEPDAQRWFEQMTSESRLFVVKHNDSGSIIGFVFSFNGENREANIGYLLGEAYWGQGLASELLRGFIEKSVQDKKLITLVAGVDISNKPSSKLLLKLGFTNQAQNDGQTVVYKYRLAQS